MDDLWDMEKGREERRREERREKGGRTPRRPHAHRRAQNSLPPPPPGLPVGRAGPVLPQPARDEACVPRAQVRQEQREGGAREVRQAAAEVVEALCLRGDGGDGHARLDAVGECDRRHERAEERGAEGRRSKEGWEERHGVERSGWITIY